MKRFPRTELPTASCCLAELEAFGFPLVSLIYSTLSGESTTETMSEDCENVNERQLSNLLLPAVSGTDNSGAQQSDRKVDILVDADDTEDSGDSGDDCYDFAISLRNHCTFNSLPSYMRSKSGVEMDPDRFRRRKHIITKLPEAESAIDRMRQIATNWDPDKNGQLLGFDCVSLDATQFKELFRRNFGVLLSARDLGILVSMYDKRGEKKADSAEFIKDFLQMGREGREWHARQRVATVQKLRLKHDARVKKRVDRMSRLKEVAVGEHTENDIETAVAKLSEVASCYDVTRDNSFRHLEQGGVMGPAMFREQLRTIFGLRLTRAEVGGLVSAFDLHREGMVDAKEFSRRFHTLGRESRAARVAEGNMRNETARRRKQQEEDALLARIREQSRVKIKWDFTQEELERGKASIAKAASSYVKGRMGGDIQGIAQMKMDPSAFRAQLMQCFRVRLGPGELGAIFTQFDKDRSMLIDGTELMNEFFRLGREERARQLAEIDNQKYRIEKKEKNFRRRLEARFLEQTAAKVIWPSLPHDPYDKGYTLNYTSTLNRQGGSARGPRRGSYQALSIGSRCKSHSGIKGQGDESRRHSISEAAVESGVRFSWRRSRPRISASTADFLAQIEKEEVAIRTMTCGVSRQRREIPSATAEPGCFSPPPSGSQPGRACPTSMPQQRRLRRQSQCRQKDVRGDSDVVAPSLAPLRTNESLLSSPQSAELGDQEGAAEKQFSSRPPTTSASLAPGTTARRQWAGEATSLLTPPEDQSVGPADDISAVPDTRDRDRGLRTRGSESRSSGRQAVMSRSSSIDEASERSRKQILSEDGDEEDQPNREGPWWA